MLELVVFKSLAGVDAHVDGVFRTRFSHVDVVLMLLLTADVESPHGLLGCRKAALDDTLEALCVGLEEDGVVALVGKETGETF